MKSQSSETALSLVKRESTVLLQGCLIALFFFTLTAIGSYSEVTGAKYLSLFEALMGQDYLLMGFMGFMGYMVVIAIAGLNNSSAQAVSNSQLGWYARAILVFPFIGFIAPAILFTGINFFTHFVVSEKINNVELWVWPLLSIVAFLVYLLLCCVPYLLSKPIEWLSKREVYIIVLLSGLVMSTFLVEKVFFNTTYFLQSFYVFMIVVCIFVVKAALQNRKPAIEI